MANLQYSGHSKGGSSVNLRDKINLTLEEEEGWSKLDYAATAVRGELSSIIGEMQAILDDEVVVSLSERLGIVSTGFLFHDIFKNKTRFFEIGKTPPTYSLTYLWDDQQPHEELSGCVHWLFLKVRHLQYELRIRGEPFAEDYFANIPCDSADRRAHNSEEPWRRKYNIHYCTVGEMLFTAFTWRVLSIAIDAGFGQTLINQIYMNVNSPLSNSECRWRNQFVTQPVSNFESQKDGVNAILFSEFWDKSVRNKGIWHEEWETLLLSSTNPAFQVLHRNAVFQFIKRCGFTAERTIEDINDTEMLNRVFQSAIPNFLIWLNNGQPPGTVNESLTVLETMARFPILPFFYWNATNGAPMCYFVAPVWTSQKYAIIVPSGKCRHLGLALSGVRPLSKLDWTLNEANIKRCSNAEVLVIISYLRLMARPLVEGNLYHWLLREIEEQRVDFVTDKIKSRWQQTDDNKGEKS